MKTTRDLSDAARAVPRGEFLAIQTYFRKQEKFQRNHLTLHPNAELTKLTVIKERRHEDESREKWNRDGELLSSSCPYPFSGCRLSILLLLVHVSICTSRGWRGGTHSYLSKNLEKSPVGGIKKAGPSPPQSLMVLQTPLIPSCDAHLGSIWWSVQ